MDIQNQDDPARSRETHHRFRLKSEVSDTAPLNSIQDSDNLSSGWHKTLNMLIVLILICLALTLLALYVNSAHSAVYRWVDQDGQTHYSQTTPENYQGDMTPVTLSEGLMAGKQFQISQLPASIHKAYCREIEDRAKSEAVRMLNSKRVLRTHRRSLTRSDDSASSRVRKQLLSHVLAFRNTDTSASDIASLALNQCLGGSYMDALPAFIRREFPERYDELMARP